MNHRSRKRRSRSLLLPCLPPELASSSKSGNDLVQMCRALAKGAIFKLRAGDFVHLWEGAFLRPPDLTPGQPVLGSQALDFIQRELPLFDVPWSVKAAMDASGVSQKDCREINPPILRCALWV